MAVVEQQRSRGEPQAERPAIKGYGIESGREGLLPWTWADERLGASRNYWVCTMRPDGRPHAAPVWGVWLDGAFYFGTGERSRKARNLRQNPAIVVHLESGDEVVILEGVAEHLAELDPALFARIAGGYAAKYDGFRPEPGEAMWVMRPHVAFGWLEQSYPKTATQWRFTFTPPATTALSPTA